MAKCVLFSKSMLEARIESQDETVARAREQFQYDNDRSNNAIQSNEKTDPRPTAEQKASGDYDKRKVGWQGLTICIENEAGSTRSGTNRDGEKWSTTLAYPYGYIQQTVGMDGDEVDCFLGPDEDAQYVYVVHARKVNRWEEYDEDKCMLNFPTEEAAAAAFMSNYSDPRFLGPITRMLVSEFVEKVQNTKGAHKPTMIKALLFVKSHVSAGATMANANLGKTGLGGKAVLFARS